MFSNSSTLFVDLPKFVKIVEVGARDGLQNESKILPSEVKIELINRLSETGLKVIEATSFVSPSRVPQMADAETVLRGITPKEGVSYPVLVPNPRGFERALSAGAKEIAVFASAGEEFSRRNINCSIEESLIRCREVARMAKENGIPVRGYVSCIFADPFIGPTSPSSVVRVAKALFEMGCYEISLGDTTGVGDAGTTYVLLNELLHHIPANALAMHFHDTYGQALANIVIGLQMGISVVDSSVSGLGGCPFAKGASGNAATEDVLYMLKGMGIETGVDLDKLIDTGVFICNHLNKKTTSRVATAILAMRTSEAES